MKKIVLAIVILFMLSVPSFACTGGCGGQFSITEKLPFITTTANWWTGMAVTNYTNREVEFTVTIAHVGTETYFLKPYSVTTINLDSKGLATYATVNSTSAVSVMIIISNSVVATSYQVNLE